MLGDRTIICWPHVPTLWILFICQQKFARNQVDKSIRISGGSSVFCGWWYQIWHQSRGIGRLLVVSSNCKFDIAPKTVQESSATWSRLWRGELCWNVPLLFLAIWRMGGCGCRWLFAHKIWQTFVHAFRWDFFAKTILYSCLSKHWVGLNKGGERKRPTFLL